ncbi:MAG: metallopeptidase family protein [Bacteroidetes bacterium]|nr:metallopeptidase family protein [Bacteroidota bacterium]MCL5739112.1 metallopeptidase family protein [Bacteroidota bacterium]
MEREKFEMLVEKAFEELPPEFKSRLENIHVVVENLPDELDLQKARIGNGYMLLGLYSGVPLSRRGADYGVYPVLPDRIKLFKENIERYCRDDKDIEAKIREVLIHEVGHYFGMTDEEIRKAGY